MVDASEEVEGHGRRRMLLSAAIFLVALNLRPALTSVGPLLPQIGVTVGLDEGMQGALGALPLLAFAVVSPLVQHPARRFGTERSILLALLVLAAGVAIRSAGGSIGLWIGTAVLGAAIAVGNVLVPALVKRDFARRVTLATGLYTACITGAAAIASVVAVPLSHSIGWEGALAIWAVPAMIVAVLWALRSRGADRTQLAVAGTETLSGSVWRQGTAWLVTAFMGLQSTTFYVVVTWLPSIEVSAGIAPEEAGVHLFLYQIVGIASGLAIPGLLRAHSSQIAGTVTASIPMIVGVAGLLVAPVWSAVWVVLAGLGSGASLVAALSLISIRGRDHRETTQLSGMAQSVGYVLAACGPVAAGLLAECTGGWTGALVLVGVLAVMQLVVAVPAGRDRSIGTGC